MKEKIVKSLTESNQKGNAEHFYKKIQKVLADDNLICKRVPEGQDSLFRAVSEALHFTSTYSKEIQELCIKHLANLITTNQLSRRLEMFRGNPMLWKDYTNNILSNQFCEISLELVSLTFKVRLTVYTVTDDGILNAMIFNNKFDQSIQLIRPFGYHFDVVHSQNFKEDIVHCQNIVLNVVHKALNGSKELESKDLNEEKQTEMTPKAHAETQDSLESIPEDIEDIEERREKIKGHRRVRSDPKLTEDANDSRDRLEYYKSFKDSKTSEEVNKLVEKDIAKFGDKEPVLPNLNQINMSKHSDKTNGSEDAGLKLDFVKSIPKEATRVPIEEEEELRTPDFIVKLEKSKSCIDPKANQKSPVHFINSLPPGLTPNRYSTKTYGNDDFSQAIANSDHKARRYSHVDEDPHNLSSFPNAGKPRAGARTLSLTIQSEEFRKNFGNLGGPTSENDTNPQSVQKNATPEKKKPVIIEESHHRYTGRLKFFDESKNYGFIVMDDDGSDIFVHYDDLHKASITKEFLKTSKFGNSVRLSFSCLEYIGKYNRSRKATDVQFIN